MESFLPMLANPKILITGLGEIGEDVVKTLYEKNITNLTICNRTKEKSLETAEKFACSILDFESLPSQISHYDIIVSTVRAEKPIIKKSYFENNKSIKYLFDLSVPRSIESDTDSVAGLVLYGLDEIQKRTDDAMEKRMAAIPEVKAIINEMVTDLENWSKELLVSPTIQKLKSALETIRQEEMSRYLKTMTQEEVEKMDKITSAMMQKIIKLPVLQLKAACKRGEAETLIDVLNDLFDLEKVSLKN
jgi:glutamyl-tRNA reductase